MQSMQNKIACQISPQRDQGGPLHALLQCHSQQEIRKREALRSQVNTSCGWTRPISGVSSAGATSWQEQVRSSSLALWAPHAITARWNPTHEMQRLGATLECIHCRAKVELTGKLKASCGRPRSKDLRAFFADR